MNTEKKKKENQAEEVPAGTDAQEQGVEEVSLEEPVPEQAAADEAVEEAIADRLLRLQADFDNYRRRMQKERVDWFTRANEDFIDELLPVLDHFEMGLSSAQEHHADPAVVEGFRLVYEQLMNVLRKNKVEPIETENREFNPHLHEAVTYMPSSEVPEEHIVSQVRQGYMLGDKLLRPAQVIISSGPVESS
jgi:molecular chaperone GrpE